MPAVAAFDVGRADGGVPSSAYRTPVRRARVNAATTGRTPSPVGGSVRRRERLGLSIGGWYRKAMQMLDEESYTRQTAIITFLWLVAMFVGGILLLTFSGVFQNVF